MSGYDHTTYMRKWRAANVEKVRKEGREAAKRHRERYPERVKARKKGEHLRRNYGLTLEAFAALLAGQENRCAICRTPDGNWVVDHDHKSGDVRGILCRQCNTGLGCFKDSPEAAMAAAKYLLVR